MVCEQGERLVFFKKRVKCHFWCFVFFLFYIFVLNSIEIKHFSLMTMSNNGFKNQTHVFTFLFTHKNTFLLCLEQA